MNQCIQKINLWTMMNAVSGGNERLAVCKALESVGMIDRINVCVSGEPNPVYIARDDDELPMFVVHENGAVQTPAEWAWKLRRTIDIDNMTDDVKRIINGIAGYLAIGTRNRTEVK